MQASNDSEEGAQIQTMPSDGPSGSSEETNSQSSTLRTRTRNAMKQVQDSNLDGHRDPKLRSIYLYLFGLVMLFSLIGLALLIYWLHYLRPKPGISDLSDPNQLANLHVVIMFTFMISLNAFSLLLYRTFFMAQKAHLKWTHALLSGLNIVMATLGVLAMLQSHWLKGIPNYYSLHSWIGLLAVSFYLLQFVSGFVSFLRPGLAERYRRQLMPWHRLVGSYVLALASLAAITGMLEMVMFQDKGEYSQFSSITFVANFAALSVIIITTTTIYLLQSKEYFRQQLKKDQQEEALEH